MGNNLPRLFIKSVRLRIDRRWGGRLRLAALSGVGPFLFKRAGSGQRLLVAAGQRAVFHRSVPEEGACFPALKSFLLEHHDWAFGHLAFDLKNEVEQLSSRHPALVEFPLATWVVPRFVLELEGERAVLWVWEEDREEGERWMEEFTSPLPVGGGQGECISHAEREGCAGNAPLSRADSEALWRRRPGAVHELESAGPFPPLPRRGAGGEAVFHLRTTKADYLRNVSRILRHVQHGDVYEMNYCVERAADMPDWDVYAAFERLLERLDPPHAAFYRIGDRFALCASPERFLRIENGVVIAQPMKGTRPRHADPGRDRQLADELADDPKERGENVMAVDVMRNDLARTARSGSVRVEELCAVRSYPRVHQMISTVRSELAHGLHPVDVLAAAWPMASMTGAPKVRAMQLIEEVETMRRGLFSGSLGIFDPQGNTDLNVVIRTVLYDVASGRASLCTGSAITALCDPAQEWEECELKARSVLEALFDG